MKGVLSLSSLGLIAATVALAATANAASFDYRHPRPSGFAEAGAPPKPEKIEFIPSNSVAGIAYDLVADFPKGSTPEFEVTRVTVNGVDEPKFIVANENVINGNHRVNGLEDFTISTYAGWQPGKVYKVVVEGKDAAGRPVKIAQAQTAPAEYAAVRSIGFGPPTAEYPYHHVTLVLNKEVLFPGTVNEVDVDGQRNRDARIYNEAELATTMVNQGKPAQGESYQWKVKGTTPLRIVAPVDWTNGSVHTVKVTIAPASGAPKTFEAKGTAPSSGGYWDPAWSHNHSVIVSEDAGILRDNEPVQVALAFYADDIGDPYQEIRVVTYDPTSPSAGQDGYVVVPYQILKVTTWRDEEVLNKVEPDRETGKPVHRFDATTTVELVFPANVQPYQRKVYEVLYGNPKAQAPKFASDLKVTRGKGLSETIANGSYRCVTTPGSGAVDTFTILGNGKPVLLEHHVETNGAMHWNPEFYSPPTPWVHASDWGTDAVQRDGSIRHFPSPHFKEYNGPILHRTERFAPLPEEPDATVAIDYDFYANQPYVLMSSYEEIKGDHFVQAIRNGEMVFNKKVFKEFIWMDPRGKLQTLDLATSRKHPVHAVQIPPTTPWLAFINRDLKVGFASIQLAFENGNRYGKLPSVAQPYIYVENGPWFYFSRPIVYPFAGKNQTRMMPVRDGSFYFERSAWLPFRFDQGDNPFATVEQYVKRLQHPLRVTEWMRTNPRAPEHWVMPILTMPFDEGVVGAVGGHKPGEKPRGRK